MQPAFAPERQLRQQHRPHAATSRQSRAQRHGRRTALDAGDFLVGLVALAGDQHDVVGAGAPSACAIAQRGRAALSRAGQVAEAGEDVGHDGVAVFGARIVVGDDDQVGARRSAKAAICGRLPRSRSPPQPNTQISRAWLWLRSVFQRLLQGVGRVRVVDHHQRLAAGRRRDGSCGRRPASACRARRRPGPAPCHRRSSTPATASRLSTLKRPSSGEATAACPPA